LRLRHKSVVDFDVCAHSLIYVYELMFYTHNKGPLQLVDRVLAMTGR
jgi:hypothetical protein